MIGANAVIGSNVFITTSIDAGARVSIKNQELVIKTGKNENMHTSDVLVDENWFYTI